MSIQTIFCPQCRQDMPHVRARAGIVMCTICRWQRPWNTTGWAEGWLAARPSPGSGRRGEPIRYAMTFTS